MKSLITILYIVIFILQLSCDPSDENEDTATECIAGEEQSCECPDGTSGIRSCVAADKYTECLCEQPMFCNDPGNEYECDCPNGGVGIQVCLKEGVLSACHCTGPARCCYDLGTCTAKDLVAQIASTSIIESLSEDTCGTNRDLVCVPDGLAPGNVPERCKSVLESDGRCLPDCLPAIAESTTPLPQSSCPEHHVCVPCVDPFTNALTDACLTSDYTPGPVGKSFDTCCTGNGFCLPLDIIDRSEQQLALLRKDSCDPDENVMCVPKVFIEQPDFIPEICTSIADNEGRCLPECLASDTNLPLNLPQDICPESFVCAPCYNPITGEPTDACTLPGDPGIEEPPQTFDRCCNDLGSCITEEVLPGDQDSLLDEDSCERDHNLVCVPDIFTAADGYKPQECVSLNRNEGRCLPDCLPMVVDSPTQLPQDVCPDHFVCAPCYDPITMNRTKACSIQGDTHDRPVLGYDKCCYGLGTCIEQRQISEDQRTCLGEDNCPSDQRLLCVPDDMIDFENYLPQYCTSIFGSDGFCTPACMPDAKKMKFPEDDCPDDFVCVPYTDPLSGVDNKCKINFPDDVEWESQEVFSKCCESSGTCVPLSLVPESADTTLIDLLPGDTCPDNKDYRCVPDSMLDMTNEITFKPCTGAIPISVEDLVESWNFFAVLFNIFTGAGSTDGGTTDGGTADGGIADGGTTEQVTLPTFDASIFEGEYIPIPESGICVPKCLAKGAVEQLGIRVEDLERNICNASEICVPCTFASSFIPGSC